MTFELYHGDCLDILPRLEPNSVDAIILCQGNRSTLVLGGTNGTDISSCSSD